MNLFNPVVTQAVAGQVQNDVSALQNPDTALNLLAQVCAALQGDLQMHMRVQAALATLERLIHANTATAAKPPAEDAPQPPTDKPPVSTPPTSGR